MPYRIFVGALVTLALIASACGARVGVTEELVAAAPPSCVHAEPELSPGLAPVLAVPNTREVENVVVQAGILFATALDVCDDTPELVLWRIDPATRAMRGTPLGLAPGGLWHGLDVDDRGNAWIATRDRLVRVDASGTPSVLPLPAAAHRLPWEFGGHARAPHVWGFATSLAWSGDRVAIGRAGHREITLFDPAAARWSSVRLDGHGEVVELRRYTSGTLAFTATRSDVDPLAGHGSSGFVDLPAATLSQVPVVASSIAAAPGSLAYRGPAMPPFGAAQALGVMLGGRSFWHRDAPGYDTSRFAVRADGTLAVRAAADARELVLIRPDGIEDRRVRFAAPAPGGRAPTPRLSAIAFGSGTSVWFALKGVPQLYRID